MGEHDQDQDDAAEPARPPLDAEQAREATAGLREAVDDVRRSVTVLAARVRDAHAARAWGPFGHGGRTSHRLWFQQEQGPRRSSFLPGRGTFCFLATCRAARFMKARGQQVMLSI
ncbi:hypothetical protein [Streptomyces prasinus]|uniref:hypothetical protein n=1 Tax=Streptomyces prasinus TaxID=67345 RepID=UPI0006E3544A